MRGGPDLGVLEAQIEEAESLAEDEGAVLRFVPNLERMRVALERSRAARPWPTQWSDMHTRCLRLLARGYLQAPRPALL